MIFFGQPATFEGGGPAFGARSFLFRFRLHKKGAQTTPSIRVATVSNTSILNSVLNEKGDFVEGNLIPTFQEKGMVWMDKNKQGIEQVKKLSDSDIPESFLHIKSNGRLEINNKR
ncbi:MAG: hypothetical protein SNJ77_10480 [Cytophagales bacterium]